MSANDFVVEAIRVAALFAGGWLGVLCCREARVFHLRDELDAARERIAALEVERDMLRVDAEVMRRYRELGGGE